MWVIYSIWLKRVHVIEMDYDQSSTYGWVAMEQSPHLSEHIASLDTDGVSFVWEDADRREVLREWERMFKTALFKITQTRKQPRYPSVSARVHYLH